MTSLSQYVFNPDESIEILFENTCDDMGGKAKHGEIMERIDLKEIEVESLPFIYSASPKIII